MNARSGHDFPPPMPPLGMLQTTLRGITETLANELAHPCAAAPDWPEPHWLLARAVATIHGIAPLLSRSSRWRGPSGWQRFLDEQRMHTRNRHARTRDLLAALGDAALQADIPIVALKGAALYNLQLYSPGDRTMADVDLLVREEDAARATWMLEQLGFGKKYSTWRHPVFTDGQEIAPDAFGEHSSYGMKIELHTHIQELLPLRPADITKLIFPRQPHAGLNEYSSRAALMTHLLFHAAGAMAFRSLRFINLSDISRVSASMSSLDWDEFLAQEGDLQDTLWWSFPPLAMTARYYDTIPQHVISAASLRCQWWLKRMFARRTLSDVSLSYLWVTAFPGIEWARSAPQMLEYIARRVAPNAQTLSLRKTLAGAELAASQSTWAHMSQTRRILRWITSRPVRAESLRPIQLALAQSR